MAASHSSLQEQLINQAASGAFQVAISLARSDATTARLLLHATAFVARDVVPRVAAYFDQVGLAHFDAMCPYFMLNCYEKEIALFRPYYPGAESRHLATSQIDTVARMLDVGFAGKAWNSAALQALIRFETFA